MKPQMLTDLKNKAVTQAIETIRNRIDSLGVSEPTIQEHGLGQYQILVQLPGVDDPAASRTSCSPPPCLRSSRFWAGLIRASRPRCRIKAEFCRRMRFCCRGTPLPAPLRSEQAWYLVSRVSAVRGKDLRDAQPSTDQNGQPECALPVNGRGWPAFLQLHLRACGRQSRVVLDNKVQEVANIKEAIRDKARSAAAA